MTIPWIKKTYLYLVSLISLILLVVAATMLINLALKQFVFTKADDNAYYPMTCAVPAGESASSANVSCNDAEYKSQQERAEAVRRTGQKQGEAAQAIAMIIVSAPVFLYHWRLAKKEA